MCEDDGMTQLEAGLVTRERVTHEELRGLLSSLRAAVFWQSATPLYNRRQFCQIVTKIYKYSHVTHKEYCKNWSKRRSWLGVDRVYDIVEASLSAEYVETLLALCEVLSELRQTLREGNSEVGVFSGRLHVEKALLPLQRLVTLRAALSVICRTVSHQATLTRASSALHSVTTVLDRCYEVVSSLHGPDYVADVDNILEFSSKVSFCGGDGQWETVRQSPCHPSLPYRSPSSIGSQETVAVGEKEWEMWGGVSQPASRPLPAPHPLPQGLDEGRGQGDGEEEHIYEEVYSPGSHLRILWSQIEPVLNSGLLRKLSCEERSLQEAKFEIITSEVSYLKSLCVLVTLFLDSAHLSASLSLAERQALFSNISQVKECSEKLLYELAGLLSEDVMLTGVCGILDTFSSTHLRTFVHYCHSQPLILHNHYTHSSEVEASDGCYYSLVSFLTLPLQRITRLPLLVDAVLSRLPPHSPEFPQATRALASLNQLVRECNSVAPRLDHLKSKVAKKLSSISKSINRGNLVKTRPWIRKNPSPPQVYHI